MSFEAAASRIKLWREHPAQMVRDLFGIEPDAWQVDVLETFPHRPLIAMLACKGPGKTACLAWLAWNFLLTRLHPKIGAVSITSDNLKDGLWAEMQKWRGKCELLQAQFEWTASRIFAREAPETWFMSFRTWPRAADEQTLGETLAGLWADNVMFLLDEAGGIPIAVLRTAEVVCANATKPGCEGHVVLAGNTTSTDGALYEAAVTRRSMWYVVEITADPDDPKRTPRIPAEYAAKQIAEYGRDDPWVMINILAKFPKRGLNTLLSADEVIAAQKRHYPEHTFTDYPLILGVDVARFGDDETVFFPRRGKIASAPLRMRGLDGVQVASHLSRISNERSADSVQIDATGGFGVVLDVYRTMQPNGLPVEFGGMARDPKRFKNKRAEMYWEMAEAVKDGLALPPVPEMVRGLSTITYTYTLDGKIQLEAKDQIKERLGRSPDLEDALACTFAHPVAIAPKHVIHGSLSGASLAHLIAGSSAHVSGTAYDPYDRYAKEQEKAYG